MLIGERLVRHVPAWFPGAGFRRWADHARRVIDDFATQPYLSSKKAAVSPVTTGAFRQFLISDQAAGYQFVCLGDDGVCGSRDRASVNSGRRRVLEVDVGKHLFR